MFVRFDKFHVINFNLVVSYIRSFVGDEQGVMFFYKKDSSLIKDREFIKDITIEEVDDILRELGLFKTYDY